MAIKALSTQVNCTKEERESGEEGREGGHGTYMVRGKQMDGGTGNWELERGQQERGPTSVTHAFGLFSISQP